MATDSLDQALELLDRRFGLVAVHKGLVPRQAFKRLMREYATRSEDGTPVSVWDLLHEEGFITEAEMANVLPAAIRQRRKSEGSSGPQEKANAPGSVGAPETPESGISLEVSEDKMRARIMTKAGGLDGLTLDELKLFLEAHEITHGVVDDDLLTDFIKADAPGAELIVAQGKDPVPGQPDELQCHFDTNPHRIGTLLEDGTMDWKDRGEIPQASEGDLVAEILPGQPGQPGEDVHGRVVLPEEPKKLRVRAGKGASFDEGGSRIHATRDGQPYLSLENQVTVLPVLKIKADVGIETGHVEFEGHVEIPGTVQPGYRVRAESLTASEIHSEDVIVAGDVIVRGGIYGARIKASGNLKAHHVNSSDLLVQGDIAIKRELVDTKAQAGGRVLLDGGVILSSEVSAAKGISCGSVGAENANVSFLQVGKDPWIKEAIAERRGQLQEHKARREELAKQLEALKTERDSVSTELGEVAQVQDKKMVARRELQEKIKKEKRKPTAKEQVLIKTLGREMEKIDAQVARLMEAEERIDGEVAAVEEAAGACAEACERLKMEVDSLTRAAKADPSHTQIKVSGQIFENTDIKGFYAKLRVKETISRCVISEKLDTDPTTSRKWYMNIAPL
ncbi:MAG: FapA family protein [Desulfosarcinaceae bacterium]